MEGGDGVTKSKAPDMDEKAANYGDRLKHALLLETLEGTGAWPGVVYAETHAGAGVYRAGDQSGDRYIHDLRQKVEEADAEASGAGSSYLSWLKEWWSNPANRESYPGSALTALRWLQGHCPGSPLDIRVTERVAATCGRLRQALGSHACVEEKSFVKELDWLTGAENLVLLVDPFGCVTAFGDACTCRGFDTGWIDHATVTDILRRCAGKDQAVVSLWWGFGQALRDHHQATCDLLTGWAQQQGNAVCRVFHDNRNHANALVGVGGGADVVRSVPSRSAWEQSWLGDVVYERT
jgi:hypothetical protein